VSNVTGSNYIPRKRAEPPIITVLAQQCRPVSEEKSCESFSTGARNEAKKADPKDIGDLLVERKSRIPLIIATII